MNLTQHNLKPFISLICFGIGFFLLPLCTNAETGITNESSSQTYSNISASANGNASIEVSHTSIINGEEYSYYYASTSPESVVHQVHIENGVVQPLAEKSNLIETVDSSVIYSNSLQANATSTAVNQTLTDTDLDTLWNAINYLYLYVKKNF